VLKVNLVINVLKATEVLLVVLALMVRQVLKVQLDDKVIWAHKVLQVPTVLTEIRVNLV